jgi:cell division septation protein DedD
MLLTLVALSSSPMTAQSRPAESPPPEDADFERLFSWLLAGNGQDAFADGIDRLIESAERVEQLDRVATELLPRIGDPHLLARTAASLGRLGMTVRDYARAAELYETAYIASGGTDLESLFHQAQALIQTGEIARAEQRARSVVAQTTDYELKRRAYALVARAMHSAGMTAEAARLLSTLAELDESDLVEPETLLLLSEVLNDLGEEPDPPIDQLRRLHPESVAVRLLGADQIRQAPLPAALLASRPEGGPERRTGPPAEPSPAGPAVTAIQVGSFSDAENARHLTDDLREIGLDALVETVDRDGRTLELVLVTVPGERPEDASRVLGTLREAGYDGFLIY